MFSLSKASPSAGLFSFGEARRGSAERVSSCDPRFEKERNSRMLMCVALAPDKERSMIALVIVTSGLLLVAAVLGVGFLGAGLNSI
jgi:hypothetical protein